MTEVFNIDCMKFMHTLPDKYFDLALADPNYGRGEHGGVDRSHYVKQQNGNKLFVSGGDYAKEDWDNEPAKPEFFEELFRVSKNQIIFGENYFSHNWGPGRIVWDKCNDGSDQSDCEIAYNSLNDRVDIFRFMWRGMMQGKSITEGNIQKGNKSLNEKRYHPTQKPIALYLWILTKYALPGWKIYDPMQGSDSSRKAAFQLGFDFVANEKKKTYFELQEDSFAAYTAQTSLFV